MNEKIYTVDGDWNNNINHVIMLPPINNISFYVNGEPVLIIKNNGELECGSGLSQEEASRKFFEILKTTYKNIFNEWIENKINKGE